MSDIRVCIAGVTGWAGSALGRGVATAKGLELVGGVSRSAAGRPLGEVIDVDGLSTPVVASVDEALQAGPDVFVEYTKPGVAKGHILAALEAGAHVVVGTSGLTGDDYEEIDRLATDAGRGVLAVGNFALTVVLLQKLAEMAAKYIPSWEVIDYAHAGKKDAPSGTARELAHRLSRVRRPAVEVPLEDVEGSRETRGARLDGTHVHSVRLPGYVIGLDVVFGMPDQKLTLRHEAGTSAEPYVEGAMLAVREVGRLVGLHRGLDAVMDL